MALSFAVSAQAQRVSRDTQTGELRASTAAEAKALDSAKRAAPPVGLLTGRANLASVQQQNGTVSQELDSSTLMYSVARRNADGTISQYCVNGSEAAEQILKAPAGKSQAVSKVAKEHFHEVK